MAKQTRTEKKVEWRHPYFDEENTGFNPQKKLNKTNVSKLRLKWSCKLTPSNFGRDKEEKSSGPSPRVQTIALVVDGSVFVADGGNNVYSIDAKTGTPRWTFKASLEGLAGNSLIHTLNFHKGTLYFFSSNCILYGLDPATGSVRTRMEGMFPDKGKGYSGRTAPSFYGNMAIVGAATPYEVTARGCVASADIATQQLGWRWFAVPPAVNGPKHWDAEANKGNISAYPNDWGETDLSGRGAVWAQTTVDETTGLAYFGTGDPDLFLLEGSTIPGPLLYTNCVVCVDARTGVMKWYHQTTPHDVMSWDIGWSVILAEIRFEGKRRKVVIAGTKGNFVYVLDAATGKLLYSPVMVGYNTANLNANMGDRADMLLSLKPGVYAPAHGGGINAALAVANNTIYVSTHRMEQRAAWKDGTYRGKPMKVMELTTIPDSPQYSTIAAIDAGRGEIKWSYFMDTYYHGCGLVVSGGVLFGVDSTGVLHMLDAETGALIKRLNLGGRGSAGVSVAHGGEEVRLFVSVGGRDGNPNKLLCYGLP